MDPSRSSAANTDTDMDTTTTTDANTDAAIESRVRAALADLSIANWEWIPIDPAFGDTADFCAEYGFDLPHCANTIIVAGKRSPASHCACIVRGSDRLDVNRTVRRLLGVSRASFASADATRQLTGMLIGGVTALALPPELPIYADRRLLEMDYVVLGAGSRSAKVKMPPAELSRLPNLEFIAGLSQTTQ